MKAFYVILILEPTAHPDLTIYSSGKPPLLFFPFIKNTVGALLPPEVPVQHIVADARQSPDILSWFLFPKYPMILMSSSASAIKHILSSPIMKCSSNSTNYLPVTLQIPMLWSHRKVIDLLMLVLQLNCCDNVHWLCLDVVLWDMTAFGFILPLCLFLKVRWKLLFACSSDSPGFNNCVLEVNPAVVRPLFARSDLIAFFKSNSE